MSICLARWLLSFPDLRLFLTAPSLLVHFSNFPWCLIFGSGWWLWTLSYPKHDTDNFNLPLGHANNYRNCDSTTAWNCNKQRPLPSCFSRSLRISILLQQWMNPEQEEKISRSVSTTSSTRDSTWPVVSFNCHSNPVSWVSLSRF